MKTIIKYSIYIGIVLTLFLNAERWINQIIPTSDFVQNSTLLFQYGGMIGYSLVIVFITMLQSEWFHQIHLYKPKLSLWLKNAYVSISVLFIVIAMIEYTFQSAVLLVLIFMLLTATLDMIRDKIIQDHEGNTLHPKKTIH